MANNKKIADETLAVIDAAAMILNHYPSLLENDIEYSEASTITPFDMIFELFKHTEGYNTFIETLSKYIAYSLPALEVLVKSIILTHLKDLFSCSVNPFLTDEILREGIVVSTDELSLIDTLKYSPFDKKIGGNFYFGVDELEYVNDLRNAEDMDAFLWFIINRANKRYTWRKNNSDKDSEGILTFEFSESGNTLLDAEGKQYNLQIPYNNCLHVFIGDVTEDNEDIKRLTQKESEIEEQQIQINNTSKQLDNLYSEKQSLISEQPLINEKFISGVIDEETYNQNININKNNLRSVEQRITSKTSDLEKQVINKKALQIQLSQIKQDIKDIIKNSNGYGFFKTLKDNYFNNKALLDFNISYLDSIKLFDSKVVAARLLDALTGALTIDTKLTYKQQLVRYEIQKMVKMIISNDDVIVSDCFFSFSNKDYDEMSRIAELRKAGLLTFNGEVTSSIQFDAETILDQLNEINSASSKEIIQNVIEGTVRAISKNLSRNKYEENDKFNFNVQINFIDNLLNELAFVLISTLFSPKIYLLLLINLRIMGQSTNFDLEGFIGRHKQLITTLIREIRDNILDYLLTQLLTFLLPLATRLRAKLSAEQTDYYRLLLRRALACFRHSRNRYNIDFNIDDVDYADIYDDTETNIPKENNC